MKRDDQMHSERGCRTFARQRRAAASDVRRRPLYRECTQRTPNSLKAAGNPQRHRTHQTCSGAHAYTHTRAPPFPHRPPREPRLSQLSRMVVSGKSGLPSPSHPLVQFTSRPCTQSARSCSCMQYVRTVVWSDPQAHQLDAIFREVQRSSHEGRRSSSGRRSQRWRRRSL